MPAVLTIILWVICLFVLYLVIRAAINGSDLAYDVRVIRKILENQYSIEVLDEEAEEEPIDSEPIPTAATCPACGAELSPGDKECPECGLTVK